MYRTRLCLGTNARFGVSTEEQIRLFCRTGFEAFFTPWDENLRAYRAVADEVGMIYQSIHAPWSNAAKLWQTGSDAEAAVRELNGYVDDCAAVDVPILVVHPYDGFRAGDCPNEAGIVNFRRVVAHAKEKRVRIAFENVEGEVFLASLMDAFKGEEAVGFCWDSGHELCYNHSRDMLALYGDRLIATHINDNLGISNYEGITSWRDDLHLMPFDGVNDWRRAASRLAACGYDGILSFELNKQCIPSRHESDKYKEMPLEQFLAEAYIRACRLAYMMRF